MGKYIFNDIFKEIMDTFDMDSTALGNMTDRDASRIRHYKTDSKPVKSVLERLINSICLIINGTNDSYVNSVLINKLNKIVDQSGLFPEDIRKKLSENKDVFTYVSFVLRRSLELSNDSFRGNDDMVPPVLDSQNLLTKVNQAHQYFESNLYQDAIDLYNEILKNPVLMELPVQNQLVHTDLGLIYRNSGLNKYDLDMVKQSAYHFKLAAKLSLDLNDTFHNAIINKYLGTVYMSLSNLENAEVNLKKGINYYDMALSALINNEEEYYKVLINYGVLFVHYANIRSSRKFLKNAISYFDKIIDYYKDKNNYFEGLTYLHCSSAYSMLTEICNTQENARKAILMCNNALKIFTVEDYPLFYAQCISNLGHIHLMLAGYENTIDNCNTAINHINHSLNIFAENIDTYSYFIANTNLTSIYLLLSNATKDYTYLDKAMECIVKCEKHRIKQDSSINTLKTILNHADVLINIAEARKDIKFLEEAEANINSALEVSAEMKYDYLKAIAESLLAKLYFTRYYILMDTSVLDDVLLHAATCIEIFSVNEYPLYNANISHLIAKAHRYKGDFEQSKHEYEVILTIYTKEKYPEKHMLLTEEYYDLCKEKGWQIILKLK